MQKQRFIYVPVTQWLVLTSVTLHVRSSTPNLDKVHLTFYLFRIDNISTKLVWRPKLWEFRVKLTTWPRNTLYTASQAHDEENTWGTWWRSWSVWFLMDYSTTVYVLQYIKDWIREFKGSNFKDRLGEYKF